MPGATFADRQPAESRRREVTSMVSVSPSSSPSPPSPALDPFYGATRTPLRTCVLVTGERFHGELLRADRTAVEFRWHGQTRFRVPTAAVVAIENPPGVVDRLHERLTTDVPKSFEVEPVADGMMQFWWQPTRSSGSDQPVRWRWRFGQGTGELTLSSSGTCDLTPPPDWRIDVRQPLRPVTAETCVAVRWTPTTWDVRIGPALALRGRKSSEPLEHIAVDPSPSGSVDHLTLRQFLPERASWPDRAPNESLDAVLRTDGDLWFGEFLRTSADGVELRGEGNAAAIIPWKDFAALRFRTRRNEDSSWPAITGRVAEFIGPSLWEPWRLERERWIAADVAPWFATSVVEHPVLGPIRLSRGDIDHRIATHPRTWQWLHPTAVHLGNNIEQDYDQPLPQGTRLSGTFDLTKLPTGATTISLDAVGLEPSGPGTPATERFLPELQAGGVRTELWINDQRVGDWNSLLRSRPPIGQPAHLRLSIPPTAWRLGRNTWEIRQQPAREDATEFDDCELARIAVELE
jgi:hypothetical protein